jgi:hypothetical protein
MDGFQRHSHAGERRAEHRVSVDNGAGVAPFFVNREMEQIFAGRTGVSVDDLSSCAHDHDVLRARIFIGNAGRTDRHQAQFRVKNAQIAGSSCVRPPDTIFFPYSTISIRASSINMANSSCRKKDIVIIPCPRSPVYCVPGKFLLLFKKKTRLKWSEMV